MSSPREQGTGWFAIGAVATLALIAFVIYLLAFRYDVPLY